MISNQSNQWKCSGDFSKSISNLYVFAIKPQDSSVKSYFEVDSDGKTPVRQKALWRINKTSIGRHVSSMTKLDLLAEKADDLKTKRTEMALFCVSFQGFPHHFIAASSTFYQRRSRIILKRRKMLFSADSSTSSKVVQFKLKLKT